LIQQRQNFILISYSRAILNYLGKLILKSMQENSLKTGAIACFTLIGISILTTACSTVNSNQAQSSHSSSSNATEVSNAQKSSQHGGMNHEMSMNLGPADADYDLRYIDSMVLHHQGAVNMAQAVLQHSQRPEMKKLAQDIITAQEKEIAQMKEWRKSLYPNAGDTPIMWHADMNHSMTMTEEHMKSMMMSMDLGKADAEFDLRFISAMIPHHEGALVMARDALSKSKRPEIQQLSQAILTSQQEEIDRMKQWRKDWYKK
jgi:uncharacterized protein (DUF305 family)